MKKILLLLFLASASVFTVKAKSLPVVATHKIAPDLSEYVGKYKFEELPFEFIEFKLTDGKLVVDAGGQGGEVKKDAEKDDIFATEDGNAKFTFKRNDEKKIVKVTLEYQGMTFEGTKLQQ
ncbi:hypothetical protein [Emticicia sp. 17c]|uniref:hypothetical protein n=1 Tax=Emticicia sp. 17c TaxID=3127704 RepID=UPI00301CDFF9